jgi:hypothetical protein
MERVTFQKGDTKMKQRKFDYKELMNHEVKTNIIVKEKNEPDLERCATAFHNLLRK